MASRTAVFVAVVLLGCGPSAAPGATSPTPTATPPATPAAPIAEPAPDAAPPVAEAVSDAGTASQPEAATEVDTSGTPRQRLMRAHFKESAEIRKAVIDGALSATIAPAQALTEMKALGTVQGSWKPSLEALKSSAKRFSQSADLPAATSAIADVGVACGSCHKAGSGPKIQVAAPPQSDKTLDSKMKRHAWASDRLWEGLYGPSDAAWKAGADALSGETFPEEVLKKGGVHARSAAASFASLVPSASSKKKPEERAKLYAALLETCSACHMAVRKK